MSPTAGKIRKKSSFSISKNGEVQVTRKKKKLGDGRQKCLRPTGRWREEIDTEWTSFSNLWTGASSRLQCTQGVPESIRQCRHQYQTMRGADDDNRGDEASELRSAASQTHSVQEKAEANGRWLVDKGQEGPVSGYPFTIDSHGAFFD